MRTSFGKTIVTSRVSSALRVRRSNLVGATVIVIDDGHCLTSVDLDVAVLIGPRAEADGKQCEFYFHTFADPQ